MLMQRHDTMIQNWCLDIELGESNNNHVSCLHLYIKSSPALLIILKIYDLTCLHFITSGRKCNFISKPRLLSEFGLPFKII